MRHRILCASLAWLVPQVSSAAPSSDPQCSGPVVYAGAQLEKLCLGVSYGPHPCQRIDAYLVESDEPAPVLIELHGGAFWAGAKSQFGSYLDGGGGNGVIELALRHGISVVSVGYRLSAVTDANCQPVLVNGSPMREPGHAFPVPHQDAAAALEFVRARALSGEWNLDPQRMAAIGISAGGTLALGLAFWNPGSAPTLGSSDPRAQRLRTVLALLAPTDFGPQSFDLCPSGDPAAWHFGAADVATFQTDPLALALRSAASPLEWIASARAAPATQIFGIYLGERDWSFDDLRYDGQPCSGLGDPLALPTGNPHAAAFGLLLEQALLARGADVAPTLFVDPYSCATIGLASATETADFLAASLERRPGTGLGFGGGKSPFTGRTPALSVFGRFEPQSRVTLWVRDAAPGASARLLLSPHAVPARHPNGVLLPGGTQLVSFDLADVDSCGFLSVELDPTLLAGGPLIAQVELVEGGASGKRVLTDGWRLE